MARPKSSEFVMPTSPVDIKRIQDAIEEYSASLTRQAAEKDHQKAIYLALKEGDEETKTDGIAIPKGIFTKMANTYFSSSFDDVVSNADKFEQAYSAIMKDLDPSVMAND